MSRFQRGWIAKSKEEQTEQPKSNTMESPEDVVCSQNNTSTSDDACIDARDEAMLANESFILQHKKPRGGATKRKRSNDTVADISEQLLIFQHSPTYLRIPASSVSALCGLHPFQHLPQLLFDYVYQSHLGQLLLQKDAQALGLALVDVKAHEQEMMLSLASAASVETKELVKQVLEVSSGKKKLQSVDEVQSIQKQIKAQAIKAQQSGKLSKQQVDSLVEASRGHVSTGFGTCHEDEALDVYEKRIGCKVRERNEALMEWSFERVHDVYSELGVTAVPLGDARRKDLGQINAVINEASGKEKKGEDTSDKPIEMNIDCDNNAKTEGEDGEDCKSCNDDTTICEAKDSAGVVCTTTSTAVIGDAKSSTDIASDLILIASKPRPFFRIVGVVDGVRDELYLDTPKPPALVLKTEEINNQLNTLDTTKPAAKKSERPANNTDSQHNVTHNKYNFLDDDEDEQWSLRPIIVECKHRMNEAKIPPPLYDQIQTCLYCHMYNVEEADLIQVVRRKKSQGEEKEKDAQKKNAADEESEESKNGTTINKHKQDIKITITRVSLSDPIHNHNHHWKTTLLPRLASFVDAVYKVRKDDRKRYRLIMALVRSQHEESTNRAEEESWRLLWEECPWLKYCDTAFGKRTIT